MAESPKPHFRQVYEAQMQKALELPSPTSSFSSVDMLPYYIPQEESKSNFPMIFAVICTFFLGVSALILGLTQVRADRNTLATVLFAFGLGITVTGCCCLCGLCKGEKKEEELELAQHPGSRQNTF